MEMWGALHHCATKHRSDCRRAGRSRPKRSRAAEILQSWSAVSLLPGLFNNGRLSGQTLRAAGKVRGGAWRPTVQLWFDRDRHPGLPDGATFYFRGGDGGRRLVRLQIMTYRRSELKSVFGKAFRAARLAAGLSQERVRELTGVAQSEISKIERLDPRANPTLETMGASPRR